MNRVLKIFLIEAFLYATSILLGILVALRLDQLVVHASDRADTAVTVGVFLFYFLLVTLLLVFFSRKRKLLFRIMIIFSVLVGGWIALLPFFAEYSFIILLSLVFLLIKKPFVFIHDLCIILAIAGVGAVVGISLEPFMVIIIAAFLSLYDVVAVYKTKHMLEIARGMIKNNSVMGIIIPFQLKDFFADLKKTDLRGRFMILGGGDIVIPLLMCVSFLSQGLFYSAVMFFFAMLGLTFSFIFFISPRVKRPIPALPPIVFMLTFGYIVLEVFYHVSFFYMIT